MSKLAIVFCATALFASVFGASFKNLDQTDTNVRIHNLKLRIDQHLRRVRQDIADLDRDYEDVNAKGIEWFKKNVTDRYNEGIEMITRNMENLGINFQQSKCKHYFDEYEGFTREVVKSLDKCIPDATIAVVETLRNAVNAAREERAKISNLTKINDTVDSDVALVISNVYDAFKQYVKLIDGSMIKTIVYSKTPYAAFLKREEEVFNAFLNCALTKKSNGVRPKVVSA